MNLSKPTPPAPVQFTDKLTQAKQLLSRRSQLFECSLIFCICLFVYLANGPFISSNDTVPNTLLAFNWLENHSLNFDAFRGGAYYGPNDLFGPNGLPYFFAEAPNGHLTSAYPIGTAVISFPLYICFFLYLKLAALIHSGFSTSAINITAPEFELQRQYFEKLAGTILTALAVVIFYLATRLRFSHAVAIISTFIYAFATLNWVVSSQGLWPHTVSNLVLISLIFCLFKANRSSGKRQQVLLLTAGVLCGLLPGIRPTSLLFAATIIVYAIFTYRQASLFVLAGASSAIFNAAWNIYYFGFSLKNLIVGGYARLLGTSSGTYKFGDWKYSQDAFWGLLFSPSRGFFIFTPVAFFAIPGVARVFRRKADADERLLAWLSITCLILFLQYCFFVPWWGAITYGTRFLVDTLPVVCYLISYFLARLFTADWQRQRLGLSIVTLLFCICLSFSTFTQVVGAFSDHHHWDTAPTPHTTRFWDWQDSQIERHAKNLWLKLNPPPEFQHPVRYKRRLKGVIEQITDQTGQPLPPVLTVQPLQQMGLEAKVKNTGRSRWFGYDTGLILGRTIISVQFFDRNNQQVALELPNLLFVKGTPNKGARAIALGHVLFPQQLGEYRMVFSFKAEGLGEFPGQAEKSADELKVVVKRP
jgi:hypothetical protein